MFRSFTESRQPSILDVSPDIEVNQDKPWLASEKSLKHYLSQANQVLLQRGANYSLKMIEITSPSPEQSISVGICLRALFSLLKKQPANVESEQKVEIGSFLKVMCCPLSFEQDRVTPPLILRINRDKTLSIDASISEKSRAIWQQLLSL